MAFQATSLETLRHMVGSGLGVTLIPELAVPVDRTGGPIVYRPFAAPAPVRTIGMLFRKGSARHRCFELLGALVKTVMMRNQTAG